MKKRGCLKYYFAAAFFTALIPILFYLFALTEKNSLHIGVREVNDFINVCIENQKIILTVNDRSLVLPDFLSFLENVSFEFFSFAPLIFLL